MYMHNIMSVTIYVYVKVDVALCSDEYVHLHVGLNLTSKSHMQSYCRSWLGAMWGLALLKVSHVHMS